MANAGDIYLGVLGEEDLLPPGGRKLRFEQPEEIIREGRVASGKYCSDLIATKQNIVLDYKLVNSTTLAAFEALYSLHQELSLKIYHSADTHDDYLVKMYPIAKVRELIINGGIWSGVVLTFKEV